MFQPNCFTDKASLKMEADSGGEDGQV